MKNRFINLYCGVLQVCGGVIGIYGLFRFGEAMNGVKGIEAILGIVFAIVYFLVFIIGNIALGLDEIFTYYKKINN